MMKNLVAVAGGGALAFALAGAVSPAAAWGSVHPAGLAHIKLANQAAPPTIRDSRVWTVSAVRSDPDDGGQ
jgi:hypothetical protein